MNMSSFKAGTRGSRLALTQTRHVISLLRDKNPDAVLELVVIRTEGDVDQKTSLEKIGGIGLFTKQIESALLDKTVDIAIHSAKDLPSVMTEGLTIGAIPEREDCRDAWLSRDGSSLDNIKEGAIVGTSSPRRRAQLRQIRSDLEVRDIRGNVDTRLRKLEEGEYDAIMMAHAGLKRIGMEERITELIPTDRIIPAPGQGFLLVQIRADDDKAVKLTSAIDNLATKRLLNIERRLLAGLNAGCSAAVGGLAEYEFNDITMKAVVLDKNGEKRLFKSNRIGKDRADSELVDPIVKYMFEHGARELIEDAES